MHLIISYAIAISLIGIPSKIGKPVERKTLSIVRRIPREVPPHKAFNIPKGERYMPHQALVVFKEGTSEEDINSLLTEYGLKEVYRGKYTNISVLEGEQDATSIITTLKKDPRIAIVEPNYIVTLQWTPNDPYFNLQWHFDQNHIRMPEAWDVEQGGDQSVKVGVLDTGIAYETTPIPSYEQSEVSSNDGNYHIAPDLTGTHFSGGYDAIHQDNHPNDQHGHGTHVSGTIAQTTNNNYGVAGIAFNVTLVPIQVLNYYGSGTTAQVIDGLGYAVNYGVNLLNMSFGSPDSSHAEHLAIIDAYNAGIILIGATGNDGANSILYPAAFPEVIAVGATDYDDDLAPYSNYGSQIDLVAPGGNTSEDSNGDGYSDGVLQQTYSHTSTGQGDPTVVDSFLFWFWQGTSMATPHVTGVAALLYSQGITNFQGIKNALINTAVDLGNPGYDIYFGHGRLDAYAALTYTPQSYWDTLSAPFEEPFYTFQEQYQVEYEATRLFPSDVCTLESVEVAFFNYGGNGATKSCSLFVWSDGNGQPGARLLSLPFTVSGIPAGTWAWVNIDVSSYNIVVSDTFWIGHFEATAGAPSSMVDTIPEYLNMWSLDATSWSIDYYDYMQRAIVKCGGQQVLESAPHNTGLSLRILGNPSKGRAMISYTLNEPGDVYITVYDVSGRVITRDKRAGLKAGTHSWSTRKLNSGIYFIEIKEDKRSVVKKVVIM